MLQNVLRSGVLALATTMSAGSLWPEAASALDAYHAGALRGYGIGWLPAGLGAAVAAPGVRPGYVGDLLDDSFDAPYGYGEYAEYGPWAYRGIHAEGCALARQRVRTANGLRWRTIRICN